MNIFSNPKTGTVFKFVIADRVLREGHRGTPHTAGTTTEKPEPTHQAHQLAAFSHRLFGGVFLYRVVRKIRPSNAVGLNFKRSFREIPVPQLELRILRHDSI